MTSREHFRSSPRPQASQQVVLHRSDSSTIVAFTRDVSTGGVFVETQETFTVGESLRVELVSPSTWDPLTLRAEVRRAEPGGVGLRFVGVSDADLVALINLISSLDFES
jgi:Tfp pilus assembly protein PilZ